MPEINRDWKDEEQIREEQFHKGAEIEADRERSPDLQYTQTEGSANATTLYSEDVDDEALPNSRFATRQTKAERIWRLNCGLDGHNCGRRRSRHKTDIEARDRARLIEPLCNRLELGEGATKRACDIARNPTPKTINFIGGLSTWLLSIVLFAAVEHGDVMKVDRNALAEIKGEFEVSDKQIADGMDEIQ